MGRRKKQIKHLTLQTHQQAQQQAHQQAEARIYAKTQIIVGFLFLAFVIFGDVLFYYIAPRSNGHLSIPALILGIQIVPIGFLIIAAINYRYVSRHIK